MFSLTRRLLAFTLLVAALTVPSTCAFAQAASASKAAAGKPSAAKTSAVADTDKLDINTATPDQLKALKGVGDAYSKRIIDGRPYTAKNQLTTRGIVPTATYNGIKDLIVARAPKK